MKRVTLISGLLILAAVGLFPQEKDDSNQAGLYLGQKPPGLTPEIFAPGVVSSKKFIEMGCTWSPDLKEFYFARSETSELISNWSIWRIQEKDGVWTEPQVVPFSGVYRDFGPFMPPDGKYIFFESNGDIYWVSAKIIKELRLKELN